MNATGQTTIAFDNLTFVAEIPANFSIERFEPTQQTVVEGQDITLQSTVSNVDTVQSSRELQVINNTTDDPVTVETVDSRSIDAGASGLDTFTVETTTVDKATDRSFELVVRDPRIASREQTTDEQAIDATASTEVTVRPANPALTLSSDPAYGAPEAVSVAYQAQETFQVQSFEYELELLDAENETNVDLEGTRGTVAVEDLSASTTATGELQPADRVDATLVDGDYQLTATLDEGEGGETVTETTSFTIDSGLPSIDTTVAREVGSTQRPVEVDVALDSENANAGTLQVRDGSADGDIVFEQDVTGAFVDQETVQWDTTDQSGTPVTDGTYTIVVTATNDFGGTVSRTRTVSVDNSAPTVENVEVGSDVANDTVTVRADVSQETSPIEEVQLGLAADFTPFQTTPETASIDGESGTVEATIDVTNLPADGDYTGVVTATDTAGNNAEATGDSVTVDTTAPEVQAKLSTSDGTLVLEVNEPVSVTNFDVVVDGTDRSASATLPADSARQFDLEFDASPGTGDETTYDLTITAEDAVGNTASDSIASSVVNAETDENGTVEIDVSNTEAILIVNTTVDDEPIVAEITQTEAPPAGTEVEQNQVPAAFIDAGVDVASENIINASIRLPIDSPLVVDPTVGFDPNDLVILRSPDGVGGYEPIESTRPVDIDGDGEIDQLRATFPGFSQFTSAGTVTNPPSITDTAIQETAVAGGTVTETVTVQYEAANPSVAAVDVTATEIDASVAESRLTRRVNTDRAEIVISGTAPDETIEVTLDVVDTRGNAQSETITVNPPEPADTSGGGGGGGGGGGLIGTVSTSKSIADSDPDNPGLTVSVSRTDLRSITFENEDLTGVVSVDQLTSPPVGAPALEDRPFITGVEIDTSAESADQAATIELGVSRTTLDTAAADPGDLVVLRATDDGYQQLETQVVDTDGDVTLSAETSDLGEFVVTTQGDDTADQSVDADESTGAPANESEEPAADEPASESEEPAADEPTNETDEGAGEQTDDGTPGFGPLVAVLALVALALAARRKQ
ncbi:MAG: PGF-CTERM archaeal protein-sorting signal [uncultured archaeon A07HR67]|nr:MAG: PGF-CTERM archaeal protein-sorting signal [uncultured archaeon A07HR67]